VALGKKKPARIPLCRDFSDLDALIHEELVGRRRLGDLLRLMHLEPELLVALQAREETGLREECHSDLKKERGFKVFGRLHQEKLL